MKGIEKEVFASFIEMNRLVGTPDLKTNTLTFAWGDMLVSGEELSRSLAFAGFVDGYHGNANRYEVKNAPRPTGWENPVSAKGQYMAQYSLGEESAKARSLDLK